MPKEYSMTVWDLKNAINHYLRRHPEGKDRKIRINLPYYGSRTTCCLNLLYFANGTNDIPGPNLIPGSEIETYE